jgi:hypothetical protein
MSSQVNGSGVAGNGRLMRAGGIETFGREVHLLELAGAAISCSGRGRDQRRRPATDQVAGVAAENRPGRGDGDHEVFHDRGRGS